MQLWATLAWNCLALHAHSQQSCSWDLNDTSDCKCTSLGVDELSYTAPSEWMAASNMHMLLNSPTCRELLTMMMSIAIDQIGAGLQHLQITSMASKLSPQAICTQVITELRSISASCPKASVRKAHLILSPGCLHLQGCPHQRWHPVL